MVTSRNKIFVLAIKFLNKNKVANDQGKDRASGVSGAPRRLPRHRVHPRGIAATQTAPQPFHLTLPNQTLPETRRNHQQVAVRYH